MKHRMTCRPASSASRRRRLLGGRDVQSKSIYLYINISSFFTFGSTPNPLYIHLYIYIYIYIYIYRYIDGYIEG